MVDSDKYLRQSMRHLVHFDKPLPSSSDTPFPKGWFDLTQEQLADLGTFFYLASLAPFHRPRSLATEFANFEPALRLKQYKIFRSGGFPRAFVTWAGLDADAERDFAVDGKPLRAEQWNAGRSIWVVDLVAPFGHLEQMIGAFSQNEQSNRIRTLWHNKKGTHARVIEWERAGQGAPIDVKSYGRNQFAKLLEQG